MKSIGVILITIMSVALQGCFPKPYFSKEESVWAYFEDWDTNKDSSIDKDEFVAGYKASEMSKKADSNVSAESMFAKADDNGDSEITGLEFYRWEVKL